MSTLVIGMISDTHGLLRPEALAALAGSDYIIHGGDNGDQRCASHMQGNHCAFAWGCQPCKSDLQLHRIMCS